MPIGKKSLDRVANGGAESVIPAPAPEAAPAPAAKPKKTEVKKTVIAKPTPAVANCANKVYAIGDELPEYLL